MSKFDFQGPGDFVQVDNYEAAFRLFEDYDIPYHLITRGRNKGKIRVKPLRYEDHDECEILCRALRRNGYGDICDHANVFRDADGCIIICFSPYRMPYEETDADGKPVYTVPKIFGYEGEVRCPGIYGNGAATVVFRRL